MKKVLFSTVFISFVILFAFSSGFAQQDPNDPGEADTLYFVAGPPCSSDGDTLYFPAGGGDVKIYINMWNDEGVIAAVAPLTDSTYGPPSNAFLDSLKNNSSPNPLCFEGSRVEHFQVTVCVLDSHPPPVLYGAVAMFEEDSLLPGDGLFATMVYTVSDTGRICLDTLFYFPTNVLAFVTTPAVMFTPQFSSKCFYLRPCPAPEADFVGNPTSGEKPLEVHFEDRSSGCPTSWRWDFGDGNTDTVQNPIHTYTEGGYFDVGLIVSDGVVSDTMTKPNYIVAWGIKAEFGADKRCSSAPLTVNFTDSSTSVFPIVDWDWNFGDGETSDQQNPSHEFQTTGAFDITLIVSDGIRADTLTKRDYVTTQDSVSADFVGLPASGKCSLTVMFEPVLDLLLDSH